MNLPRLIEEKRKEMIKLGLSYGMTSKETIRCSQELDVLLNLFDKKNTITVKTKLLPYLAFMQVICCFTTLYAI